jgi:hypothetical protein
VNTKLEDLLIIEKGTGLVRSRESERREFKQIYNNHSLAEYAKTMAAMANTSGGQLFFGIAEKPNRVLGIDHATFPDSASISSSLNNWFEPAIRFSVYEFAFAGVNVLMVDVQEAPTKPVVCKKNATILAERKKGGNIERFDKLVLAEGAVYWRYGAKNEPIRFAELTEIFRERDQRVYASLLETIDNIRRIGPERVGIADVSALSAGGELTKIYLSKEAVKHLNVIDKGRFVEAEGEGEPAYFIHGTVTMHEVAEIPVDDTDRLKPGTVVKMLSDEAKKAFYSAFHLSPSHLAKYAKEEGFRESSEDFNNTYCKWDEQAAQWFYREAFVRNLRKAMIEKPREILGKLSSAKSLELYDANYKKG